MNIYVINKHLSLENEEFDIHSDESFVKEAKRQGLELSPQQFHKLFNNSQSDISSKNYMIKVLDKISYNLDISKTNNPLPPTSLFNISYTVDEAKEDIYHKKYSFMYRKVHIYDDLFNTEGLGRFVGYISVAKPEVLSAFNRKIVNSAIRQELNEMLHNHVSQHNNWLFGEVFEYTLTNFDGKVVSTGDRFFGERHSVNGLIKSLPKNVASSIDEGNCSGNFNEKIWIK